MIPCLRSTVRLVRDSASGSAAARELRAAFALGSVVPREPRRSCRALCLDDASGAAVARELRASPAFGSVVAREPRHRKGPTAMGSTGRRAVAFFIHVLAGSLAQRALCCKPSVARQILQQYPPNASSGSTMKAQPAQCNSRGHAAESMLRALLSAGCSALLSWQGCSRIKELRGSIDGRDRLRLLSERLQSSPEVLEYIATVTKRLEPCNCTP